MNPVDLIVSRLREFDCRPRQTHSRPGQWSARCPCPTHGKGHKDRRPSLSVGTGTTDEALVSCKAGCRTEDVVAALGLRMADLYPRDQQGRRITDVRYSSLQRAIDAQAERIGGEHVATYRYFYADGFPAFVMVRFHTPQGKQILPFSRDKNNQWVVRSPKGQRPLYCVCEVISAPRVVVVEGEKCADLVRDRLGIAATTSAHGSGSAKQTDWSPLAGKEVLIVPDCNAAGCAYAQDVARLLSNLNPTPKKVTIVHLPGLEEGEDIEQWLDRQPLDWTRDQVLEAFEAIVAASAGPPRYDKLPTKGQQAIDLIREILAGGMVRSQELEHRVIASGIGERTYRAARRKAGVGRRKVGSQWYSYLDVEPMAPKKPKRNASKNTARKAKAARRDASKTADEIDTFKAARLQSTLQDQDIYLEEEINPVLGEHRNFLSEAGDSTGPEFHPAESNPDLFPETESTLAPDPAAELVSASTAGPDHDVDSADARRGAKSRKRRIDIAKRRAELQERQAARLVRDIETAELTEEDVRAHLPVLRKAEELLRAMWSRLGDLDEIPRDELAERRDIAFWEAVRWASAARSSCANSRHSVVKYGLYDWNEALRLVGGRDNSPGKPSNQHQSPTPATDRLVESARSEPTPGLMPKSVLDPDDPLYQPIRNHRDLADRPVMTPGGPGLLWQVFADRVGVTLNTDPNRVAFFHPSQVAVPLAKAG